MELTKQRLGARIKELRKSKQLSQSKLAEELELSTNALSRLEVGVSYPSLYTLEKMAKVLDVGIQDFFVFSDKSGDVPDEEKIHVWLKAASEERRKMALRVLQVILDGNQL